MVDATPTPSPVPEVDWEVTPERVQLREDAFRTYTLRVDDKEFADVRARRVFPLSGKADYVSFLGERDREVCLVVHPDRLDKASRDVLARALTNTYYRPKILEVYEVTETMGVSQWRVRTDRGYAVFEILDRNSHIRSLPGGRYLIIDVDGNRFEIEDIEALDRRSQGLVETET